MAYIHQEKDLDYLRYIITRSVAAQYFRQLRISRTQGYPMLISSLPGYLALQQLVAKQNGETVQKHLQKEEKLYLKGRAAESNQEPSLLQVDEESTYVSDKKGPIVFYQLAKKIGKQRLNMIISDFYRLGKEKKVTDVSDFYELLKTHIPVSRREELGKLLTNTDIGQYHFVK
ncbi:hypothetical protein SAMN05216436_101132 [bacterium A37T11]|nr:hypothetical protein SAMN05216436_101132 [bacterium A37T11]